MRGVKYDRSGPPPRPRWPAASVRRPCAFVNKPRRRARARAGRASDGGRGWVLDAGVALAELAHVRPQVAQALVERAPDVGRDLEPGGFLHLARQGFELGQQRLFFVEHFFSFGLTLSRAAAQNEDALVNGGADLSRSQPQPLQIYQRVQALVSQVAAQAYDQEPPATTAQVPLCPGVPTLDDGYLTAWSQHLAGAALPLRHCRGLSLRPVVLPHFTAGNDQKSRGKGSSSFGEWPCSYGLRQVSDQPMIDEAPQRAGSVDFGRRGRQATRGLDLSLRGEDVVDRFGKCEVAPGVPIEARVGRWRVAQQVRNATP